MNETLGRRLWMAALTGVPFGIYKMGFGWYEFHHDHPAIGIAAMTWGGIDILVNVLAVFFPNRVAWCLLANIGRWIDTRFGRKYCENVLLAIDTTASFSISSVMIWFGRLPLSPPLAAKVWNLAVVCNVLAVGLQQLYIAVRTPPPADVGSPAAGS
jgi:hypothetical protein